jgi:hypothetical protein
MELQEVLIMGRLESSKLDKQLEYDGVAEEKVMMDTKALAKTLHFHLDLAEAEEEELSCSYV